MSTGNKAIPDLPAIPDPTGGSLYIIKDGVDYRVDTGGIGGLATLGADGKIDPTQIPETASVQWSGIQNKPTTLTGYGITDNTFTNLQDKPTTISGYGITNAVTTSGDQSITGTKTFVNTITGNISGSAASASSVPWSGISSKPNTLAGYGITGGAFSSGISFGSTVASNNTDLTSHVSLHGAGYGFNVTTGALNYTTASGGSHHFNIAGVDRMVLTAAGLAVTGTITATGNITGYSSDKRLKQNIRNISFPMDKLFRIGGYTFSWDMEECDKVGFIPENTIEHGVLAQEVQKVVPDAVSPAAFNKDYLTVNYARLVPLLIECIKDLQNQIDRLKD